MSIAMWALVNELKARIEALEHMVLKLQGHDPATQDLIKRVSEFEQRLQDYSRKGKK